MEISLIGFMILGFTLLIKIFEKNLFFLWKAIAFFVLGIASIVAVICLSRINKKRKGEEIEGTDKKANEKIDDGGETNEETDTNG